MKKTYYGFSRGLVSMTSSDSRCLIWIWQVMTSNVKYKLNFLATATRKCSALMLGGPCCRFAYSSCGRSGKPEQCARAGASWLKWVAMLHRLRGTGNYSFLTSVKDTFWIWKKCAETNDFLKKYKELETILFRHVSQRYSLNMKEMYGDPLFFEEVPKNVLGSPKTTRYRQPSSAEFSRVQPSSAEFSRVRPSSAEFGGVRPSSPLSRTQPNSRE